MEAQPLITVIVPVYNVEKYCVLMTEVLITPVKSANSMLHGTRA